MKKLGCMLMAVLMAVAVSGCSDKKEASENKETEKKVTLILDYLPNTNHTGFYVAKEKGFFKEEGLDVDIIEPGDDSTRATLVAANKGEFGVSYQEDVTYARTAEEPLPIRAIATIIQHNTSGFVSLKKENIKSPKDFEGKVYAGWQAPSEEAVVKAVMTAAKADFSKLTMVGADGSGFASLGKSVDIQWEFEGWAVTKGRMEGYDLKYIPLRELDERLDYYTPVIITSEKMIKEDPETVQKFMNAVKKGYEYAIEHPDAAAEILSKYAPDYDLKFLKESQKYLSSEYARDADSWGVMKDSVWDNYTAFMYENKLITEKIKADEQYTNEFVTK